MACSRSREPQLAALQKAYDERRKPYDAVDKARHPALAYHLLVDLLKVDAPNLSVARALAKDRQDLLTRPGCASCAR